MMDLFIISLDNIEYLRTFKDRAPNELNPDRIRFVRKWCEMNTSKSPPPKKAHSFDNGGVSLNQPSILPSGEGGAILLTEF
jgi:hypothetical protein